MILAFQPSLFRSFSLRGYECSTRRPAPGAQEPRRRQPGFAALFSPPAEAEAAAA